MIPWWGWLIIVVVGLAVLSALVGLAFFVGTWRLIRNEMKDMPPAPPGRMVGRRIVPQPKDYKGYQRRNKWN